MAIGIERKCLLCSDDWPAADRAAAREGRHAGTREEGEA